MHREIIEIVWMAKLIFGLAALGALLGSLGWAWWLAESFGGSAGWGLPHWFIWWRLLVERGFGGELLIAAGVGATALAGPVLLFLLKPRSSWRP